MGILAFLVVLCWLILIAWGFGFFSPSVSSQKHQLKSRPQRQAPPKVLESQERDTAIGKPTPPVSPVQDKTTSVSSRRIAPKQSRFSKKVRDRPASSKHQQNIQRGNLVLQQLRSQVTSVKLPMVIATLRKMNPYAFEELLLTCCFDQGWQIQRNFRYSRDGGVDGRVIISGKVYALQAKRYRGRCTRSRQSVTAAILRQSIFGTFALSFRRKELLGDSSSTLEKRGRYLSNYCASPR